MQQIAISGVGGQGVLFVTKVLAETALALDCSVLISETHGMAQRGGNVISHLKVSRRKPEGEDREGREPGAGSTPHFVSPLIRPGKADVLIALHPDGLVAHGFYLKPDGRVFCNRVSDDASSLDATATAMELGSPVSANLVLLGFAAGSGALFCSPEEIEETLKRYGGKRQEINLRAFEAGWRKAREIRN